jgi:hypothetical protein
VLGFVHIVVGDTELAAEDDVVEVEPAIEDDVLELDLLSLHLSLLIAVKHPSYS